MHNISKSDFQIISHVFLHLLEEAKLSNHKINKIESFHVEMYHYEVGNRGSYNFSVNPCSSCTTDRYLSQQCIMYEEN